MPPTPPTSLPLAALVSPAIAKWQYVEEKARAVLDAFCHREVRPFDLSANDDLLQTLGRLFAQVHGTASGAAISRWYCFGPTSAGSTAGFPVRRQLVAASYGNPTPSLAAEICQVAMTLLRESDIAAAQLRLTLTAPAGDAFATSVVDLLRGLGEKPDRATDPASAGTVFTVAAAKGPLCRGSLIASVAPSPSLFGFVIELGAVMAALTDEDAGYQPSPSVIVVPASPVGAEGPALAVAQRLRNSGIRTDLRHDFAALDTLEPAAAESGARLLVAVGADGAPLTLINLTDGARETADLAELDRKVTQLLD